MPEWNDGLPPEIKDHPCMTNFKSVEDVCKSLVAVQPMIGVDKIPVPKDENDPNWGTIHNRLGRPEKADGYKMTEVKDLPEGFTVDPANVTAFQEEAHKLGLSQKQTDGLFQYYVGQQAGAYGTSVKGKTDAVEANSQALRKEWGGAYDANVSLANKALQHVAGDASKELAEKYGSDPQFIKLMAKIGNDHSEDILGEGAPKPGDMTPAAALAQANAMLGDASSPYHNASHPEHKAAVAKQAELMAIAYPGTEAD